MSKLNYEKAGIVKPSEIMHYKLPSMFSDGNLQDMFLGLKSNVCDLNAALVIKSITGTEADFVLLMDRAKDYIEAHFKEEKESTKEDLLEMFRECVFEYYVLTPLIKSPNVSDIKVLSWDHIVIKANGKRYVSNFKFFSKKDFNDYLERLLRIHKKSFGPENALIHFTDRKGVDEFYLRIDVQLKNITSTENNNLHIRKMPKKKYAWEYFIENKTLDEDMIEYIKDRIDADYGFLISGRGGCGKSSILNNMIDLISPAVSILVSQESDELYSDVHPQIQFEHTMTVMTKNGEKEYTLEDELRLGLLQDIDCFIIGEIKGGEALSVFTTAMSTGAVFMGTIHANDCASSVLRLAQCARYVSDYPVETLLKMLSTVPFCLIHMSSFSIDEIVEIKGFDDNKKQLVFSEVYKKTHES